MSCTETLDALANLSVGLSPKLFDDFKDPIAQAFFDRFFDDPHNFQMSLVTYPDNTCDVQITEIKTNKHYSKPYATSTELDCLRYLGRDVVTEKTSDCGIPNRRLYWLGHPDCILEKSKIENRQHVSHEESSTVSGTTVSLPNNPMILPVDEKAQSPMETLASVASAASDKKSVSSISATRTKERKSKSGTEQKKDVKPKKEPNHNPGCGFCNDHKKHISNRHSLHLSCNVVACPQRTKKGEGTPKTKTKTAATTAEAVRLRTLQEELAAKRLKLQIKQVERESAEIDKKLAEMDTSV
jgi:hypothetical protein